MARLEALLVANILDAAPISARKTTADDFKEYLRISGIVHVATHGFNDTDALGPSILLREEKFRVQDVPADISEAGLVVFSACYSAQGRPSNHDFDNIEGFPWKVLASGAVAYLGALWKVDDNITMVHMYYFYTYMFTGDETPSLAEAWQRATRRVMELDTDGLIELSQTLIKTCERLSQDPDLRDSAIKGKAELERWIRRLKLEEGKSGDLKDPFFWAAFSLAGNASQRFQSETQNN